MTNILLFGCSGMLGRYVLNVLKNDYNVICIKRENYDIEKDSWIKLYSIVNEFLKENDIIINCAGIIPQKYSHDNLNTYIKVNTLFPHKLNEISVENKFKFIHITTDCVYDGSKGKYSENDIHTTKNIYGIIKSLGEPEETTIIRTSIIGEEFSHKKSFLEWVKSNSNCKIKGYTNHFWNGVTCLTLANLIKYMIDDKIFWKGVKHIYSSNSVSKYELCNIIKHVYKLNIDIIPTEEKYKDMTLVSDKHIILYEINDIYTQLNEQKMYSDNFTDF
jgi:dTDP-4-dehydrorhamnose reductase